LYDKIIRGEQISFDQVHNLFLKKITGETEVDNKFIYFCGLFFGELAKSNKVSMRLDETGTPMNITRSVAIGDMVEIEMIPEGSMVHNGGENISRVCINADTNLPFADIATAVFCKAYSAIRLLNKPILTEITKIPTTESINNLAKYNGYTPNYILYTELAKIKPDTAHMNVRNFFTNILWPNRTDNFGKQIIILTLQEYAQSSTNPVLKNYNKTPLNLDKAIKDPNLSDFWKAINNPVMNLDNMHDTSTFLTNKIPDVREVNCLTKVIVQAVEDFAPMFQDKDMVVK